MELQWTVYANGNWIVLSDHLLAHTTYCAHSVPAPAACHFTRKLNIQSWKRISPTYFDGNAVASYLWHWVCVTLASYASLIITTVCEFSKMTIDTFLWYSFSIINAFYDRIQIVIGSHSVTLCVRIPNVLWRKNVSALVHVKAMSCLSNTDTSSELLVIWCHPFCSEI